VRLFTYLLAAAVSVTGFAHAADTWKIEGVVVDENGQPVNDFLVGTFWSANGKQWQEDGRPLSPRTAKEIADFWNDEGVMLPHPRTIARRREGGRFAAEVSGRPSISVYVTDAKQRFGVYHSYDKDTNDSPATLVLKPLVCVIGRFTCSEAGKTPGRTMAIVHPPGDSGNYKHFTQCGSTNGRFSFLLPPGQYDLQLYSDDPDARMPKPHERDGAPKDMPPYLSGVRITVTPDERDIDLGTFDLKLTPAGKLQVNLLKRVGQEPPKLYLAAARGISEDTQLTDLRGKWVLVDFWHFGCGPCLSRSLPDLIEFHDKYKDQHEQFEILAICVDIDETLKTMADVDRTMEPIVSTLWNGKRPAFPILLDDHGRSSASFGVSKFPTQLLFDSRGQLVDVGIEPPLEILRSKLK
jgi:thiol-disulfide isomerase/thioredoxin